MPVCPPINIRPLTCDDQITICGPVTVTLLNSSMGVTGTVTAIPPVVTSSVTNAPASITSVTLLAANPNRKGAIFYSDSTNLAFVKFGTVASVTSFSMRIQSQTYYELEFVYVGTIDCIWNGTNGAMRVTEFF